MCLTAEALVAFMNLLSPDIIETTPDRILIHAEANVAVWEAAGDLWCIDRDPIREAFLAPTKDAE